MILLEKCIKDARPGQQEMVRKAKQLLSFGPEVFVNDREYTKDHEILMKYRQQMGNLLDQFYGKNSD